MSPQLKEAKRLFQEYLKNPDNKENLYNGLLQLINAINDLEKRLGARDGKSYSD